MAISLRNSNSSGPGGTIFAGVPLTASVGDIIRVQVAAETPGGSAPTVVSISDGAGNVYHQRFTTTQIPEPMFGAAEGFEVWWAYAANALVAANIVVTMSASVDDAVVIVESWQGFTGTAYQTAPWGPASSFTAQSTGTSTASVSGVSSNSASGMLIAGVSSADYISSLPSVPTGFSVVQQFQNLGGSNAFVASSFSKAYSSTVSSATITTTGATMNGYIMWVDALTDQGGAPAAPVGKLLEIRQTIKRASYW